MGLTLLTTQGLNFYGEDVQRLVDIDPGDWVDVELRNSAGIIIQPGFEPDNCRLTPSDSGGKAEQGRQIGDSGQ